MSDLEGQVPQNEEEVDALLGGMEQSTPESSIEPGAKQQSEQAATAAAQEYAIQVGGKEIKAPIEKLIKWASMGYDAPNRIGELNKKLESYTQREAQLKDLESRYSPVDKFVRENPQWWQHVQQSYEQLQAQSQQNPFLPVVENLKKEVDGLKQIAQTYEQREQQKIMQQEDTKYMDELGAIQKQYPKIDLMTPDATGKSLEYKVLEYARDNGIRNFKTAFRDFYHDELVKLSAEEAKEKVISDKQSKSKLGILGVSTTPTKRVSDSVKGKSYGDLEREALQELGLT